jgi:hypothetical protein
MEKKLESKLDPIFNPNEPNKIITNELIEAISTILNDEKISCMAKEYARELIESIKKGYEIQTGEKY